MSDYGFIKVDRQIRDWEWWDDPVIVSVWMHILVNANYRSKNWHGVLIDRGSFLTSYRHLSDECGVTVKSLRRALTCLQKSGEIRTERAQAGTLITVLNYAKFQSLAKQEGTASNTVGITPSNTASNTVGITNVLKKEKENSKNKRKEYSCSSDDERSLPSHSKSKKSVLSDQQTLWFSEFWNSYPRKTGKGQAEKAFAKVCVAETDFAAIMNGLSEQNTHVYIPMAKDGNGQFIPYPSTWLNGRRWEDDPEQYTVHSGGQDDLPF